VVLRTRRLLLRPFRSSDVEAIASFAHDEDYLRHLRDHPAPPTFVANNLDVDGAWVIELDDQVVGSIFLIDELACLLDPAHHRKGIAPEAATAVIDDAFGRRGYDEIVARADSANTASRRALERLGFRSLGDDRYALSSSGWVSSDWSRDASDS
jgi:RimJ/RimL family protein N-acetyltransferase